MEAEEPTRCTPRNGCCCCKFGCSVLTVAILTIVNCVITAIIFLTIGLVINDFFKRLPDPEAASHTTDQQILLNMKDIDRITIREKLVICKTIPPLGFIIAGVAGLPFLVSIFTCCVKRMCIVIIWIIVFVGFEVALNVGYLLLTSKVSGCCPSQKVIKNDLQLDYDFTMVGTVLNICWIAQTVPGVWFMMIMLPYACYLKRSNRVNPQPDEAGEAETGLAVNQDELTIDPTASHESRLLGHSATAVQQPKEEFSHPAAAPSGSRRRFRIYDS